MKLIPYPLKGGQRCALTERTTDPRGFIHTRKSLAGWDQEVLLSAAAVEEMGRMIGMVTKEEIEDHVKHIQRMGEEIHDLKAELEDMRLHAAVEERMAERVAV